MASLPDAVPVDKLESLLTCSICLETLNDPRTLPCFHSFCECCLAKFVKKQRDKAELGKEIEAFDCPTCRSVFTLKPKEEVKEMSGSHFIRNMLDVVAIQRQAKIAKCYRCEKSATCRCISCEIFMCEKCLEAHESFPDMKKHTVLSIDQLNEPGNQVKIKGRLHCKEHKDKKLKFYCETCQELICRYCMDFNHVRPDHCCLPVEKVAEKQKEALKTSCGILEDTLVKGNQTLQAISNATQNLKENAKKAKNEINEQAKELKKKILQKIEEKVQIKLNEVDEGYNNAHEKLKMQADELKSFLDKVKGSVDLSKNLLEKGNCEEILSTQKMIEESVEKAEKECPKRMEPVHDGEIQFEVKKINDENLKILDMGEVVCHPAATLHSLINVLLDASVIFKDNDACAKPLVDWLMEQDFKWQLCYRASRDGWDAKAFHTHCDHKASTVTVVKANDCIFGGFTDQTWEAGSQGLYKTSKSSFLFSLKNNDNLAPFKASIDDPQHAIGTNKMYGPLFGKNCGDLHIVSDPHVNKWCRSQFGQTYKVQGMADGYFPAGSLKFTPCEIEVFF